MTRTLQQMMAEFGAPPFDLTDWETAFMGTGKRPKSPPPAELVAADGLPLAYREWKPENFDGHGPVAIFVPGSTSHSGHYSVLGAGLAERGVFVRIIDVRGHGLSVRKEPNQQTDPAFTPRVPVDDGNYFVGRIGDCQDRNQLIRDVSEHLAVLLRRFPFATFHLVGHSSGGGIVSRFIEHAGSAWVDSVALLAPVNHYRQPQTRLDMQARYAALDDDAMREAIKGGGGGGNPHRYVLGFNLGDFHSPLSVTQYTATMAQGVMATDPHTFLLAHRKPLLWLVGECDPIFDIEESRRQFHRSPGGGRFAVIENTSHIGLSFSAKVVEELSKWFWRVTTPSTPGMADASRSARRARPRS